MFRIGGLKESDNPKQTSNAVHDSDSSYSKLNK